MGEICWRKLPDIAREMGEMGEREWGQPAETAEGGRASQHEKTAEGQLDR